MSDVLSPLSPPHTHIPTYTESVPPPLGPPQQQEEFLPPPPQGMRDVVIDRPNLQTSFGFVLQSNTLRPGCVICECVVCVCVHVHVGILV